MAVPAADLYRAARDRLDSGEPVAMTSVVATRGSTPQKAGARMVIFADGKTLGTIGGGCIEAEVWSVARKLLTQQRSELHEFVLADDPDEPGGDVCGGTMEVFIDVLQPSAAAAGSTGGSVAGAAQPGA